MIPDSSAFCEDKPECWGWGLGLVRGRMIRGDHPEEETLELRPELPHGASHAESWGKTVLAEGTVSAKAQGRNTLGVSEIQKILAWKAVRKGEGRSCRTLQVMGKVQVVFQGQWEPVESGKQGRHSLLSV